MTTLALRQWVKHRQHPLADLIYRAVQGVRGWSMPPVPGLHRLLLSAHLGAVRLAQNLARTLWYTPLFQSRLVRRAPGLYLYGGLPLVMGPLDIAIGPGTRMSGQTTLTGRHGAAKPRLEIGGNVDVGWQTTIAVGRRVTIGDKIWNHAYVPLASGVQRVAQSVAWLQQGRIATYLLYSFVTLIVLLGLVL